jgi:antitoxin (DNA-binding transcriptional repressor) of toxin-antitoxin stability system
MPSNIAFSGSVPHISPMKSVGVRELHKNWNQLLSEHAGEEISITNGGKVVAYLKVPPKRTGKVKMPDFEARIKAIFGDRMLTKEDVQLMDDSKGRF